MPRQPIDVGQKRCKFCGKPFIRRRYTSKLEDIGAFKRRVFCSRQCMADGMVKGTIRSQHTTRHAARKLKGKGPCEICGKPGMHIHHIDRNPGNNAPQNLKRLCIKCHRQAHRKAVRCRHCGKQATRIVLGLCLKHYSRFRKWGHPALVKLNQNTDLQIVSD